MSDLDIIEIPGWPGMYARRIVVRMWQAAGSPPINDAGRLYASQKEARRKFENGTGSPADDPDRPDLYPLAHVRFGALDVPPKYGAAMRAAGFRMPYDYELWHFELPNIRAYGIVTSIPSTAAESAEPFEINEESDMRTVLWVNNGTIITFAPEQVKVETDYAGAVAVRNVTGSSAPSGSGFWEVDDRGVSALCESYGVPWYAISAAILGSAFQIDGTRGDGASVKGRFWSRDLERANGPVVVAEVDYEKIRDIIGKDRSLQEIATAVNDERDRRERDRLNASKVV